MLKGWSARVSFHACEAQAGIKEFPMRRNLIFSVIALLAVAASLFATYPQTKPPVGKTQGGIPDLSGNWQDSGHSPSFDIKDPEGKKVKMPEDDTPFISLERSRNYYWKGPEADVTQLSRMSLIHASSTVIRSASRGSTILQTYSSSFKRLIASTFFTKPAATGDRSP